MALQTGSKWKIYTLPNGFYILGRMGKKGIDENGWVNLEAAAVCGGYSGGKGIGGVASGADQTVNWDKCPDELSFPVEKIIFLIDCVDNKVKLTCRDGQKLV